MHYMCKLYSISYSHITANTISTRPKQIHDLFACFLLKLRRPALRVNLPACPYTVKKYKVTQKLINNLFQC